MADSGYSPSPAEKYKKPTIASLFSSPRLLVNFTSKVLNETEAMNMLSPTSILKNAFWSGTNSPRTPVGEQKRYWDKLDPKGLVDALADDGEITSKSQSRMFVFGSLLKIQIPRATDLSRNSESQLGKCASGSANSTLQTCNYPRPQPRGCLSATEMVLSEDYTRVISHHGPNPTTTHIFDNCTIENSSFDVGCSHHNTYTSQSFLTFCFYCNKNLRHGIDIYIYRGERAFCSPECRYQGMLLEEGIHKLEAEDFYGT